MKSKCYICGKEIIPNETLYHAKCSKKLFGTQTVPTLNYTQEDLNKLANYIISKRISVPGVQPKLSLHLEKGNSNAERLTLVGLEGDYILKPQTNDWIHLPEAEHFCMLFARLCNIQTVDFGLIPLKSGELSYITKRMDRTKKGSLHMEDFCQLSNKLTAQKYNGSMEQVGKLIRQFSAVPGLDIARFFELSLFCFLTGNSDMHLKNFSLIQGSQSDSKWVLSPSYDLIPVKIILPEDLDELALTMCGKKSKLQKSTFIEFGENLQLTKSQINKIIFSLLKKAALNVEVSLQCSFLPDEMKESFMALFEERFARLNNVVS